MKNKSCILLISIIVTFLAATAADGGLWINNLYHDNAFVKSAWFANDFITLFVVVPLLIVSIYLFLVGSQRWFLVLIGLMGYVFYNFAFYLFGASFNMFFLIYAALVSISAIALILQFLNCDVSSISNKFNERTPVKWISIYLFFISLMLAIVEGRMIVAYLISGTIPDTIKLTGLSTSMVFALDFTIVIPFSILAAILLWQRSSWGYILGIIMLVKGFTYGLVLCVGTVLLAYSDAYGKWDSLMPLYIVLAVGGLLGCWLLLKNFKDLKYRNDASKI